MEAFEQQVQRLLQNGTEEQKEVLRVALVAIENQNQNQPGNDYISNFLQINGDYTEDGTSYILQVPITSFMLNGLGITHGGITATIIDIAMGRMINLKLYSEGKVAVTSELKINYISPGVGEELKAVAALVHRGNHLCVVECKVYNDRDKLVAMASGTFFIIDKK